MFGPREVRLDGPLGHTRHRGDAGDGHILDEVEGNDRTFLGTQYRQSLGHVEPAVYRLGQLGYRRRLVQRLEVAVAPLAQLVVVEVVGHPEEPGRERGQSLVAAQVVVDLDEGLLRQVVAEGFVAAGEAQEEALHPPLVFIDQRGKSLAVVQQGATCHPHHILGLLHRVEAGYSG